MELNTTNNISTEDYKAAAAGAVLGGAGATGAAHKKLSNLAKKTVEAFNGSKAECDSFVSRHDALVKKAVRAKEGFFGKINKITKKSGIGFDSVKAASDDVLSEYAKKSQDVITSKNITEGAKEAAEKLKDKYFSKDILKSFKAATKDKTILIAGAAALIGAVGACAVKEVIKFKTTKTRIIPEDKTNI